MELILDLSKRYTYADYLTWLDDKQRELIDGFIHLMSPAPKDIHAKISKNLVLHFGIFLLKNEDCGCELRYAPYDVRFPNDKSTLDDKIYTVVQPDICIICDATKIDEKGCLGAPDLIVEVTSDSTKKYDWGYKLSLYEKYGVREYWIIDPKLNVVDTFVLQDGGKYNNGTTHLLGSKVPVSIFDGFEIDTKEILL